MHHISARDHRSKGRPGVARGNRGLSGFPIGGWVTVDYLDSPSVATIHFRFSPTAKVAPGIGIKIDESTEMRLPINDCNTQRCEASGRLKPDVLELWRSGRTAQLAFIADNDQQVTLPISLDGFDKAMAALDERYRVAM